MKGIKEMKTFAITGNPFHPLHPCLYVLRHRLTQIVCGRLTATLFLFAAVLFFSNVIVLAKDSGKTLERTVVKLADGIYTIRHKDAPDTFPQGNTTVIIGDREVLVVDSCYLPSSAREDIAEIRRWTNKPVRYLVNTHWHFDHTMGNGTYWEAFPGLNIVAHIETARQSSGYNPGWFERFPKRGDRLKQTLAAGKDANGKVLSEGERKEYQDAIAGIAPVQEEFKSIVDRSPNLTFDSEMRIDLGNREVRIMHLGRGNTAGDAIIFLPKEKDEENTRLAALLDDRRGDHGCECLARVGVG